MESDYTTEPKVIRIYEESGTWSIDGFDPDTEQYTEDVWDYFTYDEAVSRIESFIEDIYGYGYEFKWPTDHKYQVGQTVFLTEDRMPGRVVAITDEGNYVVDMGDTGVIGVASDEFIEDYDAERWNR